MPYTLPERGRIITELLEIGGDDSARIDLVGLSGIIQSGFFQCSGQDNNYTQIPTIMWARYNLLYTGEFGSPIIPALRIDDSTGRRLETNYNVHFNADSAIIFDMPNPPPYNPATPTWAYTSALLDQFDRDTPYFFNVGQFSGTHTNLLTDFQWERVWGSPYNLVSGVSGLEPAWVSYDASGCSPAKIFAYSMTILRDISGQNVTLNSSGIGPDFLSLGQNIITGYCQDINYLASGCAVTEDGAPKSKCLTGEVTDAQLQAAISGAIRENMISEGIPVDGIPAGALVSQSVTSSLYDYTGAIEFNSVLSGDSICFDSYNFDYPATYFSKYQAAPPFSGYSTCFSGEIDYTGIDDLVSTINTRLYTSGHYIWHQDFADESATGGYFEFGPLVKATKLTDNLIFLESQVLGEAGLFNWTITNADRTPALNTIHYLLPSTVKLQGASGDGVWHDLDIRTGIDWLSIHQSDRLLKPLPPISSGGGSGIGDFTPDTPPSPPMDASGSGELSLIYTLTMTGFNKCGDPFSNIVEFYKASPPSLCNQQNDNPPPSSDSTNNDATIGDIGGNTGYVGPASIWSFLKTGWISQTSQIYPNYRVFLDGFVAHAGGFNSSFTNEFFVDNINFYGVESGQNVFSGNISVEGATYQNHIQGIASGEITGTTYKLPNGYGVADFDLDTVTGIPNNGGSVFFNHSSGNALEPFTGIVFGAVTGSGFYSVEIPGYFYNSDSQSISYHKTVSGEIVGAGTLSGGPYLSIDTGFLLTGVSDSQYVRQSGIFNGSGIVSNFGFEFNRRIGFGYMDVTVTDYCPSGCSGVSGQATGIPDTIYQLTPTGYVNATAILNYNSPQSFDFVMVNNIPLGYVTGSIFTPPSYFSNIDVLVNIINSGSAQFNASAVKLSSSQILLTAGLSGELGNTVPISSTGSTGCPYFTTPTFVSGKGLYLEMDLAQSIFTGNWATTLCPTQYFTYDCSGIGTGIIDVSYYTRTFTGIWDVSSGGLGFLSGNWINGLGHYNRGFTNFADPQIQVILGVEYRGDYIADSSDVVRLTISGSGLNFLTGVSILITGNPHAQ